MKNVTKNAILLLAISLMFLIISLQALHVKNLQKELQIQTERLLDVQNTCRTYEQTIMEFYKEK